MEDRVSSVDSHNERPVGSSDVRDLGNTRLDSLHEEAEGKTRTHPPNSRMGHPPRQVRSRRVIADGVRAIRCGGTRIWATRPIHRGKFRPN
jgi:hypothetical protein